MADTMVPKISTQMADFVAGKKVAGYDWNARVLFQYFNWTVTAAGFTTAGAADIRLCKLPGGFIRVLGPLCWIYVPAGTSTADLDIGYAAYVDNTGATVVADENAFADSLDLGGAAIAQAFPLPTANRIKEFNSKDGVEITASIDTANSPAAGIINGWVAYMRVG